MRDRFFPTFLTLAVTAFAIACDNAAPPPAGYERASSAQAGEVLKSTSSATSAVAALGETVATLGRYFDGPIGVAGAVASDDDTVAQMNFTAARRKAPIRGVVFVHRDGGATSVTVIDDTADKFAQSFDALSKSWVGSIPSTPRPPIPLEPRPLPDGSGTIGVPAGWSINAQNAMVSASGPQGAVDFGIHAQIYTPQAAAQMFMRPPMVVPYGDAATEYRGVMSQMMRVPPQTIEILERTRVPWQGVAELMHFRMPGTDRPAEGVVLLLSNPVGFGTWMYYASSVTSSVEGFHENLPVLMRIWGSWKVDDHVYTERLNSAANSLKRVGQIIREVGENRRDAMDRSAKAWDHYIRETWTYEDTSTGRRVEASNDVDKLLDTMNRAEGYTRYRAVPFAELNKK